MFDAHLVQVINSAKFPEHHLRRAVVISKKFKFGNHDTQCLWNSPREKRSTNVKPFDVNHPLNLMAKELKTFRNIVYHDSHTVLEYFDEGIHVPARAAIIILVTWERTRRDIRSVRSPDYVFPIKIFCFVLI